jgi:hypothetical protein
MNDLDIGDIILYFFWQGKKGETLNKKTALGFFLFLSPNKF